MRKTIITIVVLMMLALGVDGVTTILHPKNPFKTEEAGARIRRINGYYRSNGTYVNSHYRDTSNDGYSYNNANTLGWND